MYDKQLGNMEMLFSAEEINQRIHILAKQIAEQNLNNLLIVPILKGAFVFASDLIRALYIHNVKLDLEFITISSYGTNTKSGDIKLLQDLTSDVRGRDILLIDDILESGKSLFFVKDLLEQRGATRVLLSVLLDKMTNKSKYLAADFVGFQCPDKFIVGYGMDCANSMRELPFIAAINN